MVEVESPSSYVPSFPFKNVKFHARSPLSDCPHTIYSSLVQKGLFDIVTDALQGLDEAVRLSGYDNCRAFLLS